MIRALHRGPIGSVSAADTQPPPARAVELRIGSQSSRSDSGNGDSAVRPDDPLSCLDTLLGQLAELLAATSDEQYVQRPVGAIASSMGGHIRHCLDHFAAFCGGATTGRIDYDDRRRDTPVESIRAAALTEIVALRQRLALLDRSFLARTVRVRSMIAGDGTSIETVSSLGRELSFVLSHTIHHNALIAAMCQMLGVRPPSRFGYAPATLAHLDHRK